MTIHEFQNVVWVDTPLGTGYIMLLIDYGPQNNSNLMIGLESGDIKFLETNQVKLTRNDTMGINSPSPSPGQPGSFPGECHSPDAPVARSSHESAAGQ